MTDKRTIGHAANIDATLLAAHPELAVLTLDLPDGDGEPMENERDRLQMDLILDVLDHCWKDRQDFYAAGNMCLCYCSEQARQIIDEVAEPSHTWPAASSPFACWNSMPRWWRNNRRRSPNRPVLRIEPGEHELRTNNYSIPDHMILHRCCRPSGPCCELEAATRGWCQIGGRRWRGQSG